MGGFGNKYIIKIKNLPAADRLPNRRIENSLKCLKKEAKMKILEKLRLGRLLKHVLLPKKYFHEF